MSGDSGENGERHGGMGWRMAASQGSSHRLAGYPSGKRMDFHRDISV
ncbi:hypothetical protein [Dickeya solani]|uniref:Uncharacterized protein n=1 Tax=Dickeya solani TaxID=1089444 RepID=A0AAX4EVZ6_9GAMM|nr:hypothetical protein [Dickeya solani]WOA51533.1 hypothetical protein RXA29_16690 [Dickeya solani]